MEGAKVSCINNVGCRRLFFTNLIKKRLIEHNSHIGNSPIMHPQNFKRLFMEVDSSPMYTGEFCASSLTYRWTVYTDL